MVFLFQFLHYNGDTNQPNDINAAHAMMVDITNIPARYFEFIETKQRKCELISHLIIGSGNGLLHVRRQCII